MKQKLKWQSLASKLIIGLLALGAYGYIVNRLLTFRFWDSILASVDFSGGSILVLLVLSVLWFLNLFSETKKWQVLLSVYHSISFGSAFRQVLAGTVTAAGSPARIAEMGGRMAMLAPQFRVHAALMTGVGGLMQTLIIIIGGLGVLLLPASPVHHLMRISGGAVFWYLGAVLLVPAVIFSIVFKLRSDKIKMYLLTLKKIRPQLILTGLFWTLMRYIIYNVQLYFWMYFFGVNPNIEDFILYSPLYFMLITIIPSYILLDMGIRGSIAFLLFDKISENEPLILAAVFAQWLSNVAFPTLWGTLVLLRCKMLRQNFT